MAKTFVPAERGVAAASTLSSFAALFSAAACCVLPLLLAALGLGTGVLGAIVPYHWPLTIISALILAVGWVFYLRKRSRSRATFALLSLATAFVFLSAIWPSALEAPLMAWLA